MATALDTKLVPTAKSLINKYGASATYTKKSGGTYNPDTGEVTGISETEYTVKISPPYPVRQDLVAKDVYKAGDATTYISNDAIAFTPENINDSILIGTDTFTVISVRAVRSGDLVAVWELVLRKN